MDAMLGNDERGWLRQVEHLAGAVAGAHGGRHRRPAGRAGRRVMIDDPVRLGNLPQGLAFMTILPARWLVRRFPQARHPRRLLEPVTRWRLAAVGTVQSQPSLKFGDTRFQGRDLGRLRLDAGTAAWSSDALAQPSSLPTIGILGSGSRNGAAPYLAALQGGMRELGYVEGRDVTVTDLWADRRVGELDTQANE